MRRIFPWLTFAILCGLMVWMGLLLRQQWLPAPVSYTGWCCVKQGQDCQVSANNASCRAAGGKNFTYEATLCYNYCHLKKR